MGVAPRTAVARVRDQCRRVWRRRRSDPRWPRRKAELIMIPHRICGMVPTRATASGRQSRVWSITLRVMSRCARPAIVRRPPRGDSVTGRLVTNRRPLPTEYSLLCIDGWCPWPGAGPCTVLAGTRRIAAAGRWQPSAPRATGCHLHKRPMQNRRLRSSVTPFSPDFRRTARSARPAIRAIQAAKDGRYPAEHAALRGGYAASVRS